MSRTFFYSALAILLGLGVFLRFLSANSQLIATGAFTLGWLCAEAWRRFQLLRKQQESDGLLDEPAAFGWLTAGVVSLTLGACAIGFGIVTMVARWLD